MVAKLWLDTLKSLSILTTSVKKFGRYPIYQWHKNMEFGILAFIMWEMTLVSNIDKTTFFNVGIFSDYKVSHYLQAISATFDAYIRGYFVEDNSKG